jgi:hypothetical protein
VLAEILKFRPVAFPEVTLRKWLLAIVLRFAEESEIELLETEVTVPEATGLFSSGRDSTVRLFASSCTVTTPTGVVVAFCAWAGKRTAAVRRMGARRETFTMGEGARLLRRCQRFSGRICGFESEEKFAIGGGGRRGTSEGSKRQSGDCR